MSTITLAELRSRLRITLSDSQSKRWKVDTDLDLFIAQAAMVWSSECPYAAYQSYAVSGNTYDFPDDAVAVRMVEGYFTSTSSQETIFPGSVGPGMTVYGSEPLEFYLNHPEMDSFYIPKTPQGDTFTLYYGKHHPRLSATQDLDLGTRAWGEMAVLAYAAFLAHNPASAFRAAIEQWADKQDQNVDNPLEQEGVRWLYYYDRLVQKYWMPSSFSFVML